VTPSRRDLGRVFGGSGPLEKIPGRATREIESFTAGAKRKKKTAYRRRLSENKVALLGISY